MTSSASLAGPAIFSTPILAIELFKGVPFSDKHVLHKRPPFRPGFGSDNQMDVSPSLPSIKGGWGISGRALKIQLI